MPVFWWKAAGENVATVFRKYLVKGKPGYVPHQWAELADAVGWIRAAGGVAVIAIRGAMTSAASCKKSWCRISKRWAARPSKWSAPATLDQTHKFALLAARMELLASAGSDFHAPGEGGPRRGAHPGFAASVRPGVEPLHPAARHARGDQLKTIMSQLFHIHPRKPAGAG